MEKLELKHLAPYLTYGLKCYSTTIFFGDDESRVYEMGLISLRGVLKGTGKPILIPLSFYKNKIIKDIKDELELSHDQCMEFLGFMDGEIKLENISYGLYISLCKFHIDFNKLIEKNLAIDINTIEP